jgi:hypothetical protein
MNSRRLVLMSAALIGVALLASGCEWARWLRLLSFKKQLAKVERFVRVEDQGGLTLHFLKPVVYAEDLSLLLADETFRTTNQNRVSWCWTYEKQVMETNVAPGMFDLSFSMLFQDGKFNELRFPERFLALMPKALIIGLLRSVGQAEVDMKHGQVTAKWVGPGPNHKVELPTRSRLTELLGQPFLITKSNGTNTYLYKYYQKVPTPRSPAEKLAWAKFTFSNGGEEIATSEGVIGNVGWSMTRVANEPEPRVTFSLVPLSVEPVAIPLPSQFLDECVGRYREPEGTILNVGRDGQLLVLSWTRGRSGGWCAALPELTNTFFGVPTGLPRGTFLQDQVGAVTGLVAQLQGSGTLFQKFTNQLPPVPGIVQVSPSVYTACAGRYKAQWGGFVLISSEGEQLFWQNESVDARLPLYPSSETNFFFKAVDSPLIFVRNRQGQVTKFILQYNGHTREAVKLTDADTK